MADNNPTGAMSPQQLQSFIQMFNGGAGTNPSNDMGQLLGSLFSMYNLTSGKNNQNTQQAVNLADPNAPFQSQYAGMLNTALTKPGSYDLTPGAQFAKEQGLEAVARHGNAMFGTTASGGTAIELEKYATGFAEQNYNNYIDQLLRATTGSPAAADILTKGKNQGNSMIGTMASSLGSLLQAAGLNPQAIGSILKSIIGGDSTNPGGFSTVGGEVTGATGDGTATPGSGGLETGGFPDMTGGGGGSLETGGFPDLSGGDWTSGFDLNFG